MSLKSVGNNLASFFKNEFDNTSPSPRTDNVLNPASLHGDACLQQTRIGEQSFHAACRAHRLHQTLNAQQASSRAVQNGDDQRHIQYRVPVPDDYSSQAMRDFILREKLGYSEADIRALDESSPQQEFYIHSASDMNRPATSDEVRNLPQTNGETEILVKASLVKNMEAFRERRAHAGAIAERATNGITDSQVRLEAKEQLTRALTFVGNAQVGAAMRLSVMATGDSPTAQQVARMLQGIADQPQNSSNSALQLAAAHTLFADARARYDATPHPKLSAPDFTQVEARLQRAVQAVHGADRATAAAVNTTAAATFKLIGRDDIAFERETVGRFYEVNDTERQQFAKVPDSQLLGASIARWRESPNGAPTMRGLTAEEQRLHDFDKGQTSRPDAPERDPALGKAQNAKRMGENRLISEGTSQRRAVTTEDKGEIYTGRRTTESQRQANGEAFTRETYRHQQVNPQGVERGQGVVGAVDVVNTVLSYAKLYKQTVDLEQRNALRAPLERAAVASTRLPVPPRPAEVERMTTQLERARAATTDPQTRGRIDEALHSIAVLKEMSRAFWQ